MILIIIFTLLIVLEISIAIYSFSTIKDSVYDNEFNTEKSKNLSLTSILFSSITFPIVFILYYMEFINSKRTIINLSLISILNSVLLFLTYHYLQIQSEMHPNYDTSKDTLKANTENINKTAKEIILIVSSNTIIISGLLLSAYIGYAFFSRPLEDKIHREEKIIKSYKKPKIKLKLKDEDFRSY